MVDTAQHEQVDVIGDIDDHGPKDAADAGADARARSSYGFQ